MMKKNIKLIFIIFFFSIVSAEGTIEVQERKELGLLHNNCNEKVFYSALYNFSESFRADFKKEYEREMKIKYVEDKSFKLNDISLNLYPNKISFFWQQLSTSQQEKINRFCFIDELIHNVTPMESDEDINFVEIIYQMPKLQFIIDEYIEPHDLYYSIRNSLDGRPYFDFIKYLTYMKDEDFDQFIIEYRDIYEKLKKL